MLLLDLGLSLSNLVGKYGNGSDVTTWKINFRCALNGLKDIIERRELEEPDCRVYQMLPASGLRKIRRNKRRHSQFYSSDTTPERDVRPRLELRSPVTTPTLTTPTLPTPTLPTIPTVSVSTGIGYINDVIVCQWRHSHVIVCQWRHSHVIVCQWCHNDLQWNLAHQNLKYPAARIVQPES